MSAKALPPAAVPAGMQRRALRLAVGTAVGFTAAKALDWPIGLLAPILFIQLSAGLPGCPSVGMAVRTIAGVAGCTLIGWLATFTIAMPILCVLVVSLLLFTAFRLQARDRTALAPFILMIAVCVLPVIAIKAPELATLLAIELIRASAVAFVLVWGTWALFPDPLPQAGAPPASDAAPTKSTSAPPLLSQPGSSERARIALINTLVVMPVVLMFLLFTPTSAVIALITTLAIVRTQTQGVQLDMTGGLIEGNLVAALAAVLATAVIFAVPSIPMLFLVVLLAVLILARRMIADPPARAPVWIAALVATVALLDGSLSALSDGAGTAAWSRVINLAAAILYTTAALRLTADLRHPRQHRRRPTSKQSANAAAP